MNLESLCRQSLQDIRNLCELPKYGFIAGGSISNLIWEKVSGNKAVINDIDVYIFDKKITLDESEIKKTQHYISKDLLQFEDYRGDYRSMYVSTDFYSIDKVSNDGILNNIWYNASKACPETILQSFDLNCCQVGYNIDEDKFYYTKEFKRFLETGNIEVTNLGSPAHTAIRLVKKKYELKAKYNNIEMDMIEFCIGRNTKNENDIFGIISGYKYGHNFVDSNKFRFRDRYANMFNKYKSDLSSRFILENDIDCQDWISKEKGENINIWRLSRVSSDDKFKEATNINRSIDFIYYVKNIFGKEERYNIWNLLYKIFDLKLSYTEYVDVNISKEDLSLLSKLIKISPNTITFLRGYTLSKQIGIVKKIFDKYKLDPIIGISILETYRITDNIDLDDDFQILLLELSVRKNILSDPKNKVINILGPDDIIEPASW